MTFPSLTNTALPNDNETTMLRINSMNRTRQQSMMTSLVKAQSGTSSYSTTSTPASRLLQEDLGRKHMVHLIEELLRQHKGTEDGTAPVVSISKIAQALESHLYKRADTLQAHVDPSTLNARLRIILKALVLRRIQKKKQDQLRQNKSRQEVLRETLGKQELARLRRLVKKIRTLKVQLFSCCNNGTTRGSFSSSTLLPSQQPPPLPARKLFFETPLVTAVERTPPSKISTVDWKSLMDQAQENIHAYQEWIQKHTTQERRMSSTSSCPAPCNLVQV